MGRRKERAGEIGPGSLENFPIGLLGGRKERAGEDDNIPIGAKEALSLGLLGEESRLGFILEGGGYMLSGFSPGGRPGSALAELKT